ncbi:MAG: hypothetical protein ACR2PJ_00480 [Pseudomonadales bacterium]
MKPHPIIIAAALVACTSTAAPGSNLITKNAQGQAEGLFHIQYPSPAAQATGQAQAVRQSQPTEQSQPATQPDASATSLANLTKLARQFLMSRQELLGIDSPDQLDLMKATTDSRGGRHLRFVRTYKNILVSAMDLIVHFDVNAKVTGINGNIVRLPSSLLTQVDSRLPGGKPTLTPEQAQAFVANDLGIAPANMAASETRPLIINKQPYVIWELSVQKGHVPYIYRISDESSPQLLSKNIDVRF